jgi:hypothetical protein
MSRINRPVRASALALALAASMLALPAAAQIVVVASAKSGAGTFSKEQVSDVFMGKNTSFTPVDLAESSPLRDDFYGKVVGKSASQMKSYWAKMAFTGKGTPPREAASSGEVKKILAGDATLVGYIEKAAVDSSVKVLFSAQ